MPKAEPFANSLEHILAEMRRLDLLLRRAVLLSRSSRSGDVPEEFRGLVISEDNVDRMLDSVDFLGDIWRMDDATAKSAASIDRELEKRQADIRARMQASEEAGHKLALPHLASTFGLSPAEVDVLLIALAPELEPRYETLYAYLQNDVTRKRCTVNLALNLICRSEQEKLQARDIFSPDSTLLYFHLLELNEEPYDRSPTLLRRFMKMNDSVARFLLERQPTVTPLGEFLPAHLQLSELETSGPARQQLQNLAAALTREETEPAVVQLWGNGQAPLKEAAESLAVALGRDVLYVEMAELDYDSAKLAEVARNAVLWDNLLVLDCSRPAAETDRERQVRAEQQFWKRIGGNNGVIVVLNTTDRFVPIPTQCKLWRIKIDPPGYEARRLSWTHALREKVADFDANHLADLFTFSGQRVQQIANLASSSATLRDLESPRPNMNDVMTAARDLTTPNLQRYALMVEPKHTWDDLVLPPDRMRQLHSIVSRLRYRSIVHQDWGFGKKMLRGRGLSVLFSGPSGAGKNLAAEVLASELSLHLFQIDLSAVVSKYIGETESRLSEIFREAELSQSLLFFDEADSLFGKRTEISDAQDRFANMEVNFLLQRMEQYEGLVVLATNFQKNLDDAFLRRLYYAVEFPFPDEAAREKIWRLHLAGIPVDQDVDVKFLANSFVVAGGSVRNVVLEAAFHAAEELGPKGPISITHLLDALKREYQKQGKLVMKADLGRYANIA